LSRWNTLSLYYSLAHHLGLHDRFETVPVTVGERLKEALPCPILTQRELFPGIWYVDLQCDTIIMTCG